MKSDDAPSAPKPRLRLGEQDVDEVTMSLLHACMRR